MSNNNLNIKLEDDDLKFMPLSIRQPFTDKDSNWFPAIDLNLPQFNNIQSGFVLGFTSAMNNCNLQAVPLKTLDYTEKNDSNIENNNMEEKKEFQEDFNLYYPSETLGEELYSYNKNQKCKKCTNNVSVNNMNNIKKEDINYMNIKKNEEEINNIPINKNRDDKFQVPVHMDLLRNLNFESCLEEYRGEETKIQEIDKIFKIIQCDKTIIDTLKAYNLPKPIYDLIIKKVIKITLENSQGK